MHKILLFCLSLLCLSAAYGQETHLHSPSELLSIADKSKLSYNLVRSEQPFDNKPDTNNVLHPDYYRIVTNSGFGIRNYEPNIPAMRSFRKAESAYRDGQLDTAEFYYLEAYRLDTTYTLALTYAGQASEHMERYEQAAMLLKHAITKNYIDYLAHWFLANTYVAMGKNTLAQESIIVAHLLNRNNPRVLDALKRILALNGHSYDDSWFFNPQVAIKKMSEQEIQVTTSLEWIGYGMGEAIWLHEPGYKESMSTNGDLRFNLDMQKELLLAELIYMEAATKKEKSAYPADLKALKAATDKKLFQPYVFYEIFLTQYPQLALQLPLALMNDMREYILNVRCSK